MANQVDTAQMRLCSDCGTEWYSVLHYSDHVATDCGDCGSPLLNSSDPEALLNAPGPDAARIERTFGPFLWRADQSG